MRSTMMLPAFATIALAASKTSDICSTPTATITAQADVSQYADCEVFDGSFLIASTAGASISLDGPEQVTGDVVCENAGALTTLGSTTINAIGGSFTLTNLTLLSTLSFTELQSAETVDWAALPALFELTFPATLKKASSVTITNTFLSTLDGINLMTVDTLNINNNNRLKTFSTQLGNVTQLLNLDSNGNSLDVSFPNLIWAANMTLRNVSSVSLPSLAAVNGSLGFYGNYFSSLSAPNLTVVGSSLAFVANPSLGNVTIPLLKSIGGANLIANNSDLITISFPVLSDVQGAIDFSGNFSTPNLPDLTNVKGGFNLQSTAQVDCSAFDADSKSGVIQGKYTCKTTANAQSGLGSGTSGGSSTTSGSSPSSTSTKNAAVSYGLNEAVAGLSVVGGLLQMLL